MNKLTHFLERCNNQILFTSLFLCLIGISSIASISISMGNFPSRELIIQLLSLVIGLILIPIIVHQGYMYFISLNKYIYFISLLLLLSVYIPGVGLSVYGSRAWLDLMIVTVQPSEIVKVLFIIIMASYLCRHSYYMNSFTGILPVLLYALPFIIIVAKEDFGSGCVYCAILIFMIFCSGLHLKAVVRLGLSFFSLSPLFYFFMENYQKNRIDAFFNPSDLQLPGNYQVWNSKVAIGSGGFLGKGYTNGTQNSLGFLPVPQSDFIFSSTVEELGFIGGFVIILLFGILLYNTLKIAKYSSSPEGMLISAGICGMFLFQAFVNIGMTMGIMPVTGITLPFVSYGGTSLLSSMLSIGFLLSISCHQRA